MTWRCHRVRVQAPGRRGSANRRKWSTLAGGAWPFLVAAALLRGRYGSRRVARNSLSVRDEAWFWLACGGLGLASGGAGCGSSAGPGTACGAYAQKWSLEKGPIQVYALICFCYATHSFGLGGFASGRHNVGPGECAHTCLLSDELWQDELAHIYWSAYRRHARLVDRKALWLLVSSSRVDERPPAHLICSCVGLCDENSVVGRGPRVVHSRQYSAHLMLSRVTCG